MKVGDLVFICSGDPTVGIFLGHADDEYFNPEINLDGEIHPLHRSSVLFDEEIYSVPTFQLEVVSECR